MKTLRNFMLCISLLVVQRADAQSTEVEQLLLNAEKLTQLRNILDDMKQGYTVLSNGYKAVKNVSQGNFSLHEVFIEGLKAVNPEIKKYPKVIAIIRDQASLNSEYKSAFKRFKASENFGAEDIEYLGRVYTQLLSQSLKNLDELLTVITASDLRMSDAERLRIIDQLFEDGSEKLQFLRAFNRDATLLSAQRATQRIDQQSFKSLYPN